jgi:hypothetical protein
MVTGRRTYLLIILLIVIGQGVFAQGHLFSKVNVNSKSVYVGQPVEVTVSVHTSTWFTKGVDPGNIKVNDAFTLYFRSVSSSEIINGKTYAGVEMIFNVFPYTDEDIVFPSLEINVETPDEGTSKSVSRTIKTNPITIKVKQVPVKSYRDEWMVSPGVSVTENWSGNLKKVKVGDVLERTVSREVQWLVAELIPPIIWDTVAGVSIYPSRAEVKNNKSKTAISASRTDGVKYLFEKEGEIEIPELVISWWNPQINKMQKRTLKKVLINVQANPDLGMLESIRDSLSILAQSGEEQTNEKAAFSVLGFSLKQLIVLAFILLLVFYVIYKLYSPLKNAWIKKREKYINSELYFFRKFQHSLKHKDANLAANRFYRWLDQINIKESTIAYFVQTYGTEQLIQQYKMLVDRKNMDTKISFVFNRKAWNESRKKFIKAQKNTEIKSNIFWINP